MAVEITVEGIPRGEIERAVARLFRKSTMNLYGRSVRARTRERMIEEVDPEGTPWAHGDRAGTGWSDKPGATWGKGATGVGVRLIDRLVADTIEG